MSSLSSVVSLAPDGGCAHPREQELEAPYRAYLFGPFRIFRGHEVLGGRGNRREKALLLLKWFLLHPGRPCSIDELVDLGWPDTPRERAVGGVHVAIHTLRRMLEPELLPGEESSFIRRSGNTFYRFEPGNSWWTDVDEVVRLFDRARTADRDGDTHRASFYYHRVAARPLDRFLEGDDDDCVARLVAHRTQFQALYAQSLVRLIEIHRRRGEVEESIDYAYQMLVVDPYHELAATVIAQSHLRRGGRAHAVHRLFSFLKSGARAHEQRFAGDMWALCDRVVEHAAGPGGRDEIRCPGTGAEIRTGVGAGTDDRDVTGPRS